MDSTSLKAWRKAERERLIAARLGVAAAELETWRLRIDVTLVRSFPGLASARLAFCWPIKGEYDARHIAKTLRSKGALTALPVVISRQAPLVFREWHPGVELATGPLDIPYPVNSPEVTPQAVLLPMNGWDLQGYRLGYGGGFFDRTLAAAMKKPVTIGISFEFARIETIYPQSWDIPMDYVVTERGVYRRDPEGLAYLGEPPDGDDPSALASPVCYAGDVTRG